jgi:hypothetical protein
MWRWIPRQRPALLADRSGKEEDMTDDGLVDVEDCRALVALLRDGPRSCR